MSLPVAIASPADVDLQLDDIRPSWIIEGAPEARSKRLAGQRRTACLGLLLGPVPLAALTGIILSTKRCTSFPERYLLAMKSEGTG
jgi:hypothetical protein